MHHLSLLIRFLFASLIFSGFVVHSATAQVQYGNAVVSEAGSVTDDLKAADGNLNTNATIEPTLALGYTKLRVSFPALAAVGQPAGLYITPGSNVSAALLGGATVNTYMQNISGTTQMESYQMSSSLISLKVQQSGLTQVTFSPTKQFNQIELVFASTVAVGHSIAVYEAFSTVTPLPLPVQLTTFQGKATPTGVALTWATASELHSSHFVVERADDPAADFRALGQVQAAGSSAEARYYQFTDAAPALTSYYRLRQVDQDGQVAFSPIVIVRTVGQGLGLAAYPSPATTSLTITGLTGTHLGIFNQLGQQVQLVEAMPAPTQQLDVSSLPGGVYFLRDAASGQSIRFVKAAQ